MYTRSTTTTVADTQVPQSTWPHSSVEPEQSTGFDRRELTGGEVTSDEVTTVVFPTPLRTRLYPWLARRITGVSSPASMAARQQHAVVSPSSPAMMSLGEHCYDT